MKTIQLSENYSTIVDEDIFNLLKELGATIYLQKSTGYALIYLSHKNAPEKYKWKNGTIHLHTFVAGKEKGKHVDHANRNKLDNRRENLRIVDVSENSYNKHIENKNGRGIYFDRFGNRFRACISKNNKTIKLGSFKTIIEAKIAYNKKAKEIHGENAYQHKLI